MNKDPWELLGELNEDEPMQVLTRLYAFYDQDPAGDEARQRFFDRLRLVLEQVRECNLNRR